MKTKLTFTEVFVGSTVIIWIIYDLFAVLKWGIPGTESYTILHAAHKYPIIPLGVGIVIGHLFWPNVDGNKVIK